MRVLSPSALASARAVLSLTLDAARFQREELTVERGPDGYDIQAYVTIGAPFAGRLDAVSYDETRDGPELHAEAVAQITYGAGVDLSPKDRVRDLATDDRYEVVTVEPSSYAAVSIRQVARLAGPLKVDE